VPDHVVALAHAVVFVLFDVFFNVLNLCFDVAQVTLADYVAVADSRIFVVLLEQLFAELTSTHGVHIGDCGLVVGLVL